MNERVALVTGAGRGIGRGIALALAEGGWTIVVNYRTNESAAAETVSLLNDAGGRGVAVQANIAEASDREQLLRAVLAENGRFDLLVNNAGMAPRQRLNILEASEASYDEVMAVNLKGPFFLTQLVANHMIDLCRQGRSQNPKIINVGSISAYTSSPNRGEYCLSKAGLGMMTTLFADVLAPYGINVYEIRPGIIATDMTSGVKDMYDQLISEGLTPIQRWGLPADIGRAVVAISKDYFPFSTGEVFNVDGGFHMRRL